MTTNGNQLWQAQLEEPFRIFYALPEQQKPARNIKMRMSWELMQNSNSGNLFLVLL